ncbi:hypothetical protein [Moraxella lacunata]
MWLFLTLANKTQNPYNSKGLVFYHRLYLPLVRFGFYGQTV